jgi:hypothetical protein
LALIAVPTSAFAEPLPFNDGTYVTHPEICFLNDEQRGAAYTDRIGALVRVIKGSELSNSYELFCDVTNVEVDGNAVTFRGDCESEGEAEVVQGKYTRVSENAFRVYGETFRRCGSDAAITTYTDGFNTDSGELLNLWHDANGRCRGGSGDDPKTLGACGEREEYDAILVGRGWCYGEEQEFGYQMFWAPCLKSVGF